MKKPFLIFTCTAFAAIVIKALVACTYSKPIPRVVLPNQLSNMFGINAYEWNFLQDPAHPTNASHIFEPKMKLIKGFTAVRHYLDWEKIEETEGNYTFNPTTNGGWNYDAIYERCKQDGIDVLVDLKTCPPWLVNTYPANERDNENVPAPYGLNRNDPASYALQAKAAFQFAARYGYNKKIDASLVKVNSKPRWTNDEVNQVKTGLGLIKYIECDNERDKWWKGKKARQTAEEYAANLSAFYDGDKGRLGKNAGVKSADPNMKVVMCGIASADANFVQGIIDWCRQNRGIKADGSIDLCFDVINYHYYANGEKPQASHPAERGIAPELSDAGKVADQFIDVASKLKQKPEVWITEAGYDVNPQSPQRAIAIGNKNALITQADWILRTSLLYMRHGIKRLFFYQLFDDNQSSTQYGTSGLADAVTLKPRPAEDYLIQANKLMGKYTYQGTISQEPLVDVYTLGNKKMVVLMVGDEKGRKVEYQLNTGDTKTAVMYTLIAGADTMQSRTLKPVKGKLTLTVTETPVFVALL
jgi:hypothetical protein